MSKKFWQVSCSRIDAMFLFLVALGGGGCGASGGDVGRINNNNDKNNNNNNVSPTNVSGIAIENLNDERLKDCDISEYISQVMSVSNDTDFLISDLDGDDVIFFTDASKLTSNAGDYPTLEDIQEAYNDEVVIAAVYPDSNDVEILCDALDIEDPAIVGNNGYFELFAAAQREVDGEYESFSYVIMDLDDIISENGDGINLSTLTSRDPSATINSEDIVATGSEDVIPENITEAEFNKSRVMNLVEWVETLNTNPESLRAIEGNTEASFNATADRGQLTEFAKSEGSDTINIDYRKDMIPFPSIKGIMELPPLYGSDNVANSDRHSQWKADRRTRLKYDVYSIHSFDKNRDYFLIRAYNSMNTHNQFTSIINQGAAGAVPYNFARLMWGFTRGLSFNHFIEQDTGNGDVSIVASAPSNKAATQTTSDTVSYSFGAKVGLTANVTKAELSATADFNFSVGYSSTVSNTAIDYEIATRHNGDKDKKANASWEYIFSWPKRGKGVGNWSTHATQCYEELVAWPSSKEHTSRMEWIWEINPEIWNRAKDKKLLTVNVNTEWQDGLAQGYYFRRVGKYWGDPAQTIAHKASAKSSFTIKRPPHLAARPMTFTPKAGSKAFDKSAGNASFVVLSESDWTVKTDSDWIMGFTPASGTKTGGNEFSVAFSYSENESGRPRSAIITLTNTEGDKVEIRVNQGAN